MPFAQEVLYPIMPVFIQKAMISSYGYMWKRRRFGGIFNKELIGFKGRESFSESHWREFQSIELRKLLEHSFETVPFYNKAYKNAGFTLETIKKLELNELAKLPILSKEHLRRYGTSTLVSLKCKKKGRFFSSSGSSGTPTQILFSNDMHQKWSAAFEARIRNWAGLTRFNSRGMIGGRRIVPSGISKGPFYRYNNAEKQIYFSAYHISPQTAENYAYAINKYKPDYMTGYAMSNYFLASIFDQQGIRVPNLEAVITSSEQLSPEMRETFLRVYGCKTYDSYSGVEACGLISENEYGQLLISPDVGIMEILNDNGEPCRPGEEGEIYSTGFINYDQPLIRYRIGDRVKLAEDQATRCGRNMVVVDKIIGRSEDVVQGPDGRVMVRFHGIYLGIPGLQTGQLVQHDLADFTVRLQTDSRAFNRAVSEKIITDRLISQMGTIRVRFEYRETITPGPNGKFKAVISELLKD
ncbi:MAG: phenylacetate--CoA ligase family protein [Bacteroidales bacterium]